MSGEKGQGRLAAWLILVTALAALSYGARATGGKPPKDILYHYSAAALGLVQYALILSVVLLIVRGRPSLLALRRPASWKSAALTAVGVLVAIYALGAALNPLLDPGREQGLTPSGWDPSRAWAFAANFAVISLVAPIVEELTFRGLGFGLLERFGRPATIALIGIAFGLVHGLLAALPLLIAFGCGLAYLRSRTGSIYPPMLVHALFNAIALTAAVST